MFGLICFLVAAYSRLFWEAAAFTAYDNQTDTVQMVVIDTHAPSRGGYRGVVAVAKAGDREIKFRTSAELHHQIKTEIEKDKPSKCILMPAETGRWGVQRIIARGLEHKDFVGCEKSMMQR